MAEKPRSKIWMIAAVVLLLLTLIPIISYALDDQLSGEDALSLRVADVYRISVRHGDDYWEVTDPAHVAILMEEIQALSFQRHISLDETRTLGNTIIEVEAPGRMEFISEVNNRFSLYYHVPFLSFLTTYYDVEDTGQLSEIVALSPTLSDE